MIELVNVPDVAPLVVLVASAIVGFILASQTKLAVVIVAPLGLLMVPPPIADVVVREDAVEVPAKVP